MSFKSLRFLILLLPCIFLQCKKDETITVPEKEMQPPLAMVVLQGNYQVGRVNADLRDTIVVKIKPADINDAVKYTYTTERNSTMGSLRVLSKTVINGEVYVNLWWTTGAQPQQQELKLYITNCKPATSCKQLDSITVVAKIKDPWRTVYTNTGDLRDIKFTDDNNALAVGDYSTGIVRTNDGGKTWSSTPAFRSDLYKLRFLNSTTGFVVVTNNFAYFTYDGGKTFVYENWTPPTIGHLSSNDFYLVNRNIIYSAGVSGSIAKTIDGGRTWQNYKGFSFINNLYGITCVDENTCYACGDIAKVVKTENGGKDWKEQEIMINNSLKTIYFLNKDFGFAAGQYGALIRTTTGGAAWDIIKTGLGFNINSIRFFNNSNGIIVSTGGEIAETADGGLTWKVIVGDNNGVNNLEKVVIKDAKTIFGIQNRLIVKYDLP